MANPFDDPDGTYLVLTTGGRHRSLWPAFIDVPTGWSVEFGPATRPEVVAHLDRTEPGRD